MTCAIDGQNASLSESPSSWVEFGRSSPKMSLGQKLPTKMDKVSTWANRPTERGQTPGDLDSVVVQFFGISEDDYPDALADAVFQLELEVQTGYLLH